MSQQNNTFKRDLKPITQTITRPDTAAFADDPLTWLKAQAKTANFTYLLAHADDGIIWGKVAGETISLASDHFEVSPPFRAETLQQVRLFGPTAELYLWRNGSGWQARLITDGAGETITCFDEPQILWGNYFEKPAKNGFSLVNEGEKGHRHAVPLEADEANYKRWNPARKEESPYRPLRLGVRHYLTEDEQSGQLRITLSRLTHLIEENAQ